MSSPSEQSNSTGRVILLSVLTAAFIGGVAYLFATHAAPDSGGDAEGVVFIWDFRIVVVAGVLWIVFWMVVAWRAMKAHETLARSHDRLADAVERLAEKDDRREQGHPCSSTTSPDLWPSSASSRPTATG